MAWLCGNASCFAYALQAERHGNQRDTEVADRVARRRPLRDTHGRPAGRILSTSTPAYVEVMYGCPSAGMILAMLNYRLNPNDARPGQALERLRQKKK